MQRTPDPLSDFARRLLAAAGACALAAGVLGCLLGASSEFYHWFFSVGVRRRNPPIDHRIAGVVFYLALAFALFLGARRLGQAAVRPKADPLGDDPFAPPTCSKCGYDLRATPRQCPECGTDTCFAELVEDDNATKPGSHEATKDPATKGNV